MTALAPPRPDDTDEGPTGPDHGAVPAMRWDDKARAAATRSTERVRARMTSLRGPLRQWVRWRRLALWGAVALVVFVVLDLSIGELHHDRKQRQAVADFSTPSPWVSEGRALALIQITEIGMNTVIVEGVRPEDLRAGPGHWRGTPDPGKPGNAVVIGHRRRFGGPFAELGQLAVGDRIVVKRLGSQSVAFTVSEVLLDVPSSAAPTILAPVADQLRLTLVTADEGWWPSSHVVVVATAPIEASPVNQPANDAAAVVPDSFDPGGDPFFNRDMVMGGLWLSLGSMLLSQLRLRYRPRTAAIVSLPLLLLGGVNLWLAFGRLLPPLA